MSIRSERLALRVTDLVSGEDRPGFPRLVPLQPGIRIHAAEIAYAQPDLSFHLLVTYCFPREFVKRFQRLDQALTLLAEDAASGLHAALSLADPHKRYPALEGENYRAGPPPRTRAFRTGYREIPLGLSVEPPDFHPSLFLRVVLQDHVSNVLAFDLSAPAVVSYQDGRVAPVELVDMEIVE
ncbi:MAG: hypothetical protein V1774_03505 [Candidatus Eisenbacteria bacterium]